jgi:hypothetical protein
MVNLILAVKNQAEHDEAGGKLTSEDKLLGGPMASWRKNWVESSPWDQLWMIMLEEDRLATTRRSAIKMCTRRYD